MRRICCVLLLFCWVVAGMAQRFTYEYRGVSFKCKINNDSVCIKEFDVSATHVIIPATVLCQGVKYPVKEVSTFLNGNNYLARELTLEDGIKEIDKYSFNEFRKLERVELPSSIRYIGKNAFRKIDGLVFVLPSTFDEATIRNGREYFTPYSIEDDRELLAKQEKERKEHQKHQKMLAKAKAEHELVMKEVEKERLAKEQAERELLAKKEKEKQERLEKERLAKEQAERELLAKKEKEKQARLEKERLAKEKAERELLAKQEKEKQKRLEKERLDKEQKELEARKKLEKEKALANVDIDIPITEVQNKHTYCAIIANENYQEAPRVAFAINDGIKFSEYCQKTLGVPERNIRLYKDAGVTDMIRALRFLEGIQEIDKNAKLILYYSGHGMPNEQDRSAYLLPTDGSPKEMQTCISMQNVYRRLGNINVQSVAVFLDACFSGMQRGSDNEAILAMKAVAIETEQETLTGNVVVFSAASSDQTALVFDERKHGLFTYHLLRELKRTKGTITLGELFSSLENEVKKTSFLEKEKMQKPSVNTSASMRDKWMNIIINQ